MKLTDLLLGRNLPVVESQRPQRMPPGENVELNVPADRTSVYYSRWLRDLGAETTTV